MDPWRTAEFAASRLYEVEGKRLGIVGLGNIGKKVARRVRGFDMDVRYFDILRLSRDREDALGVRFALFPELLRTSDVVTLHVPLNDATRRMMSTREFAMMKPTTVLINTCRGPVVEEDALYQALTSKTIAAAGLDVMVQEPPAPNHPLFSLPNVTSRRTAPGRRGTTGRRRTATASTTSSVWRPGGHPAGSSPRCKAPADSSPVGARDESR